MHSNFHCAVVGIRGYVRSATGKIRLMIRRLKLGICAAAAYLRIPLALDGKCLLSVRRQRSRHVMRHGGARWLASPVAAEDETRRLQRFARGVMAGFWAFCAFLPLFVKNLVPLSPMEVCTMIRSS